MAAERPCGRAGCPEVLPSTAPTYRLFCSRSCQGRAAWARNPRPRHEPKPRIQMTCPYCTGTYEVTVANAERSARCPADACRRAHNARVMRERGHTTRSRAKLGRPASTREADERRRIRLAGGEVERFARADIFDRDGWTCQLCREPIDPALKWPDPASASIDHVLPVSHGGGHTRANVQAAHVGCNSRKGARADPVAATP